MADDPKPAGWSIFAAGRSKDPDVLSRLQQGLAILASHPAAGVEHATVKATDTGWELVANGRSGDPGAHAQAKQHVADLISAPDAETGSSEINGPYVADQNFHRPAPIEPGAGA